MLPQHHVQLQHAPLQHVCGSEASSGQPSWCTMRLAQRLPDAALTCCHSACSSCLVGPTALAFAFLEACSSAGARHAVMQCGGMFTAVKA